MKNIVLVLSILLNLVTAVYFLRRKAPQRADNNDVYNAGRRDVFRGLGVGPSDTVFIGDSITEGFPLQEMMGSLHFRNRGIGSNVTSQVLERVEELVRDRPASVFLMMGTNDLRIGVPVDTVVANYRAVIDIIQSRSPDTRIFVQSVLPVAGVQGDRNQRIKELNTALERLEGIVYIDLHSRFVAESGELKQELSYDGLHLNYKGYKLWAEALKPFRSQH